MGEFLGLIPEELLHPEKKEEFLMWLRELPIDPWTKKYVLKEWCDAVGIAMTEDLVRAVIGYPALTWG